MKRIYKEKTQADYWYSDVDIYQLLVETLASNHSYKVIDSASHDYELHEQDLENIQYVHDQTLIATRVSEAVNFLNNNDQMSAAVIPINLGQKNTTGIWEGRHWVGLVLRRNSNTNDLEAFYSDSCGKELSKQLPFLKQILKNHHIETLYDYSKQQQSNGHDCGPWTVFNLDSLAKVGSLPENITETDILHQRLLLSPYYDDSSDEENDTNTIYNNDLQWMDQKLDANDAMTLLKTLPKNFGVDLENLKLSFILHEMGIRLLKSTEVNSVYYPLKAHKLQKTLDLSKQDLNKFIDEQFTQIFKKGFNLDQNILQKFINKTKESEHYHELFLDLQKSVKENNSFIAVRKTLLGNCTLEPEYKILDWLAYIRLINCSTKRDYKNTKDSTTKGYKVTEEKETHLGIKLSIPSVNHEVDIHYTMYNTTGSKKSLVKNIGAYTNIEKTLGNIKSKFDISDAQISALISDILNNTITRNSTYINISYTDPIKLKVLVEYITNLTSLLFLEEAHRNPASLIVHAMILELVKYNNLTWEDALKSLPMSPSGATAVGIWMNQNYNNSVKYNYDCKIGKKTKHNDIIEQINMEAKVFKDWLDWKQKTETNITTASKYSTLELLINACKGWYNVNLKYTFMSDKYLQNIRQNIMSSIEEMDADYSRNISLDYQDLKGFKIVDLKKLVNFGDAPRAKDGIIKVLSDIDYYDIEDILHLVCQFGSEEVTSFLVHHDEHIYNLLEKKLDISAIFDIYYNDIIETIATDGIRLSELEDADSIEEIIEMCIEDRILYDRLVNDKNGLIEEYGYQGAKEILDSDGEVDSSDAAGDSSSEPHSDCSSEANVEADRSDTYAEVKGDCFECNSDCSGEASDFWNV